MRRTLLVLILLVLGAATAALAANPDPPTPVTGDASNVSTNGARVSGTLTTGTVDATYQFEYGTSTTYGLTTPTQTQTAQTAPATVTADVTGLTPATVYHYRLDATNAAGAAQGDDRTFTTSAPPPPPVVATGAAISIAVTTATINGTVNPQGAPTTFHVDYGTSTAYSSHTAAADAGTGTASSPVSQGLAGLKAATTYHYRVVAVNANGTVNGTDRSFKTLASPVKPSVSTQHATSVSSASATLNATVTPNKQATTVTWQYGTSTAYGQSTPAVNAGAGSSSVNVKTTVTGLAPSTTYHFRALATNASGTVTGSDRTFATGRNPLSLSLGAVHNPVTFGHAAALVAQGTGSGASGLAITLQAQSFPFSSPFADHGNPLVAGPEGSARFIVTGLTRTTRFRVIGKTARNTTSRAVTVHVRVRVGLTTLRLGARSARLRGSAFPALSAGTVSFQRRGKHGNWVRVGSRALQSAPSAPSRFSLVVRRRGIYRAVVHPMIGGLLSGHSRMRLVRLRAVA